MLCQVNCQNDFLLGDRRQSRRPAAVTPQGRKAEFQDGAQFERATTNIFSTDDASADQPKRWLWLGLRLRSVVTGAIAPLGHELVELSPVLGKTQPLQKLLKLALFFLKSAQRVGAIFVESAIAA
jgi:hypothetical protein